MFEKWLSSIGIGGATVDAVLNQETIQPGKEAKGVIKLTGGKADQPVTTIELKLIVEYYRDDPDSETHYLCETIESHKIDVIDIVHEGEHRTIPFSFPVPLHAPMTTEEQKMAIETIVHIPNGKNCSDRDEVDVFHPLYMKTLEVVKALRFSPSTGYGRCTKEKGGHLKQRFTFSCPKDVYKIETLTLCFEARPHDPLLIIGINETEYIYKGLQPPDGFTEDAFREVFRPYKSNP
ncbi:sporulation protein (plasmid) [Pontibacillus sp. ALD_SL1]|uniref:sporulation protein n=1 Tax=Pontibacillus sp. ALD_SL1 TaxID=2777185 RepID=UPI001A95E5CD|nr:sporulation protein [Pontibacillus sp. ALD_SL1]QST02726.1 sporulation protein [Pontibacillus sp. ALD_SL1]